MAIDYTNLLAPLLRPVSEGGMIFCACTVEEYSISGVTYSWLPVREITWGVDFSRLGSLSDMDCKDCFTAALKEISACCDFSHKYVANARAANLLITTKRLDGSSGVLADCQVPVGNMTPDSQLLMRLDDSENWAITEKPRGGEIDLYRVFLHEAEHGHGLGHKPASIQSPALIAPLYSPALRNLQAADKSELVRRYGPSKVITPPAPAPQPGAKPVQVVVIQDGKQWSGELPRVK